MSKQVTLEATATQLIAFLHKGGKRGYWWTEKDPQRPEETLSTWWPAGKPAAIPVDWKNTYFGVHPATKGSRKNERSKNETIAAINCLFADFDAKDFEGNKEEALAHIKSLAPQPSVLIDSGGGYHAYWLSGSPIRISNKAAQERIAKIQATWVKYAGGDPSSKDLARVLRVPGTENHKYIPPREVYFVWAKFDHMYDLEALIDKIKVPKASQKAPTPQNMNALGKIGEHWLAEALSRSPMNRHDNGLWLACQLRDARLPKIEAEIVMLQYLSRVPTKGHPYTEKDAMHALKDAYDRAPRDPAGPFYSIGDDDGREPLDLSQAPEAEPQAIDQILLYEKHDHEGHARCVVALHAGIFAYSEHLGWMFYNGRYWQRENAVLKAERAIVETLRSRRQLALNNNQDGHFEKLLRKTAASSFNVNGTKKLLSSLVAVDVSDFDSDPDLLNVKNGVLDLRTGELQPHSREQKFTYCLSVDYDPKAPYDRWFQFLLEATSFKEDLVEFLKQAVGYSLTGHTWEEILFYIYGPARAGKGTFTETLIHMLGNKPLSTEAGFETFTADRYGDTQNFDLAPLKPCRFVAAGESNKKQPLNPAKIKQLTGGNFIYCAYKHREHFSYQPQFKIWLSSNHQANVDVDDDAAWSRVKVIEFPISRVGHEDKRLKRDLAKEENLRGVLRWAVEGAREWYQADNGLQFPETVTKATAAQRESQDFIRQYLIESTQDDLGAWIHTGALWESYKAWCDSNGVPAKYQNQFSQALKAKGYEFDRKRNVEKKLIRVVKGLKMNVTHDTL